MGTTAGVVVRQAPRYVRRQADIELWVGIAVLENVNVSLVCGHGDDKSKADA
jgi:hypothetical protein